jgi:hypothetical protein
MPWVFMFMLGSFASGLVLYWIANNTITFTQQYIIMRSHGHTPNLFGNIKSSFSRKKPAPADKEAPAKPAAAPKAVKAPAAAFAPPGAVPDAWAAGFRLNDACLALSGTYHADTPALERVLSTLGGDLVAFVDEVRRAGEAPNPREALLGTDAAP